MSTTTTLTAKQTKSLLDEHAKLIAAREAITGDGMSAAGKRASATRRIDDAELKMYELGVTFTPWTPPATASKAKPAMSDEQVLTRIAELVKIADDTAAPTRIRATADKHCGELVRAAVKRSLKVSPALLKRYPARLKRDVK